MDFNKIKAVVFDFDGVFTDNRVIISEEGKESVICNRSDGIGLEMLRKIGIPMKIISPEKSVYEKNSYGGTSPKEVKKQITNARKRFLS